jgi:hypothetical protein
MKNQTHIVIYDVVESNDSLELYVNGGSYYYITHNHHKYKHYLYFGKLGDIPHPVTDVEKEKELLEPLKQYGTLLYQKEIDSLITKIEMRLKLKII